MDGLRRGDICICHMGAPDKRRPVLVLTPEHRLSYLTYVTVAPITSTLREAKSQIYLDEEDLMHGPSVINFDQITTVTLDRIEKFIGHLSHERMHEVCAAIRFALGCD